MQHSLLYQDLSKEFHQFNWTNRFLEIAICTKIVSHGSIELLIGTGNNNYFGLAKTCVVLDMPTQMQPTHSPRHSYIKKNTTRSINDYFFKCHNGIGCFINLEVITQYNVI